MKMELLPISNLRDLFDYDQNTGDLCWKESRGRVKAGHKCQTKDSNGRYRVEISGRTFAVHQIAWAITTGRWSDKQIDHINGVKTDNRLSNLREATNAENARNRNRKPANSGFRGVSLHKGRFVARIMYEGKCINLGSFSDPQVAAHEYNKAAVRIHGDFCVLNPIGR